MNPYPYYELRDFTDLKDLVMKRAEVQPELTAFVYPCESGEMKKSYFDFKEDIVALGSYMYSKGIKDKHVVISGENSYEWLVTFFATVCGGNVAVAIDKGLPEEEITNLMKTGDGEFAFASQTYIDKISLDVVKEKYSFDDFDDMLAEGRKLAAEKAEFLAYEMQLDKTAAILFTSGTSGVSKGVELTNKNIAFEITRTCQLFELKGDTISVLPYHHAFGLIVGVFMVLNYGYATYINKSLKTMKKNMAEFGPQTLFLVPMFVEFFHRQIWAEVTKRGKAGALRKLMKSTNVIRHLGLDVRKKTYGSILEIFGGNLEYIICGGAPLDPMYVKEFRTWGIEILNGYGTTECSPCTAVNRPHYHKDGSVGVIIPETEIMVTDEGEICFKGDHVMKGYYKNQAATDEVLIDGWYHTGDLGYVDEDGFIILTGRKKNLIILSNGENISPEELEQDIARDPAVQETMVYDEDGKIYAAVYPTEDHAGDQEYFDKLTKKINKGRPLYKQIVKIHLRDEEFIKNGSMKIVRYKNIPEKEN